ncbi:enoyl-CoA hydratase/isomerase family protein [Microbacterium sp. BLY]|uniref:enoyl-CoA hydratase/isomerase family protein n=1 Tax=Microbacterium sp. BLY TaxID=2823280 RepID=UPI001B323A0A|nr:enoyl-CoA hydratase/isomerase family protein [Microbacterium sp. BLY]MBP3977261.1 enoyl-CoA hydratase/isomerase family protein [Microbacterium sp. BLY]
MSDVYETIDVTVTGPVAHVRLHRPERRNALSALVMSDLSQAFERLARRTLAGVVLSGAGTAFSAGADLRELRDVRESPDPGAAGRAVAERAKGLMARIEQLPFPTIACVDGPAVGGGLELALACDTIHAGPDALFALPEPTLGLLPGFGGVRRLVDRVGPALASEMVLTGRRIDGGEALAHGLATRLVPSAALTREAAASLTAGAPRSRAATALARTALRAAIGDDRETAFAEETRLYGVAFAEDDSREGIAAFLEKRPPAFASEAG